MNSGRMTFRFDNGKIRSEDHQLESGTKETVVEVPEENKPEPRGELYSLEEARQAAGGRTRQDSRAAHSPGRTAREYRLEELEKAYNQRKTDRKYPDPYPAFPEPDYDEADYRESEQSRVPSSGDSYRYYRRSEAAAEPEENSGPAGSYSDFDYGSPLYRDNEHGGPAHSADEEDYPVWGASEDDGGGYYTSGRPSSWWRFPVSVAGALAVGLMLGYAALHYLGGGHTGNTADQASPQAGIEQSANGGAAASAVSVQLPAQTYYLLQYGVFSTPQGAEQAKKELADAGLAAGIFAAGDNRVYAGLSADRGQAEQLAVRLKAQGIEPYLKELTLPAVSRLSFGGDADAVSRYFDDSGRLLGELSSLSASLLGGGTAADAAGISDLHMLWSQDIKALEAGLPAEGQAAAKEMETAVSRGISAMSEYQKSKADGLLWEVQSSMLDMLSGQQKLLAAMEVR
ncbi:SPOR domain-containing protein [Paenibacillus sp. HN-1]|uniref:SPOR domain-containing protein n=1 Tax=Paenibacillus TaxID=44249 RepID=UPI001CA96815|nr:MULTISPECIES: SPOR domain-containing protein [Paenibacillus]MBY9079394.1 SPOR domain-containing protein [Paenibacillus sp. CGMCC 1.18879]MBY9085689.1 SPOR domain-containing protein [Paenibacillus sinensis]